MASMAKGDPPSHRAQTLSPAAMTEVLAALTSSLLSILASARPAEPKPGTIMAPAAASWRRLGVSAKRAWAVARPSPI